MVKITTRTPTDHDISTLARTLRDSDRQELIAATYLSPYEAIKISVDNSDPLFCNAYYAKGNLLCIAGCTITGNPWLLATPELQHHIYRLTKTAKEAVPKPLRLSTAIRLVKILTQQSSLIMCSKLKKHSKRVYSMHQPSFNPMFKMPCMARTVFYLKPVQRIF